MCWLQFPFTVEADASDFELGAVLLQKQNDEDKVIYTDFVSFVQLQITTL